MTPEARRDFAADPADACPGFIAVGPPRRARKSELLDGTLDGAPVIAKRLLEPKAVWAWYQQREIAMYRAFVDAPPGVRVPHWLGATSEVLVIERIIGAPLATTRRPAAALPREVVSALIASHDKLAPWRGAMTDLPPSAAVRAQLRERLLEDPTAPRDWVLDGIARAARRGVVERSVAERVIAAITNTAIAFSHGDLLLRNVIASDAGGIVLVDWECAGFHLRDWDLALLWTQLAPGSRELVEQAASEREAFLGLVVFALVREVRFLQAFNVDDRDPAMRRTRGELADAIARLPR